MAVHRQRWLFAELGRGIPTQECATRPAVFQNVPHPPTARHPPSWLVPVPQSGSRCVSSRATVEPQRCRATPERSTTPSRCNPAAAIFSAAVDCCSQVATHGAQLQRNAYDYGRCGTYGTRRTLHNALQHLYFALHLSASCVVCDYVLGRDGGAVSCRPPPVEISHRTKISEAGG